MKSLLVYCLKERFARSVFICAMVGFAFGGGYVVALVAQPHIAKAKCEQKSEDVLSRTDRLEKEFASKKDVKWSYYDALIKDGAPKGSSSGPAISQRSPHIAERLAKVLGDEAPESIKPSPEGNIPTTTGSPFAIQVASLPDLTAAQNLASRLKAKGYNATLVQAEVAQKGKVFRVRLHGFQSREEADQAAELFEKKEKMDVITVEQ